jgi:hypothetical protein
MVNDAGERDQGKGLNFTCEEWDRLVVHSTDITREMEKQQPATIQNEVNAVCFPLSAKTYLYVKFGEYGQYLKLMRSLPARKDKGVYQSWINISLKTWNELKTFAPEVGEVLNDLDPIKDTVLPLPGNQRLTVMPFKGKQYVGLQGLDEEGNRKKGKTLNLVPSEWNELMKLAPDIDAELGITNPVTTSEEAVSNNPSQEIPKTANLATTTEEEVNPPQETSKIPKSTRRSKRKGKQGCNDLETVVPVKKSKKKGQGLKLVIPTPLEITQYRWRSITKCPGEEDEVEEGARWYFTEARCRQDFEEFNAIFGPGVPHDNDDDDVSGIPKPSMTLVTQQVKNPTNEEVMKMVYISLLREEIRSVINTNCYGCEFDRPSQIDHMAGGCLQEWESAVDQYTEFAKLQVTQDRLIQASQKVLDILKPGHNWNGELIAKLYLCMSYSQLCTLLKEEVLDPPYQILFLDQCKGL